MVIGISRDAVTVVRPLLVMVEVGMTSVYLPMILRVRSEFFTSEDPHHHAAHPSGSSLVATRTCEGRKDCVGGRDAVGLDVGIPLVELDADDRSMPIVKEVRDPNGRPD